MAGRAVVERDGTWGGGRTLVSKGPVSLAVQRNTQASTASGGTGADTCVLFAYRCWRRRAIVWDPFLLRSDACRTGAWSDKDVSILCFLRGLQAGVCATTGPDSAVCSAHGPGPIGGLDAGLDT